MIIFASNPTWSDESHSSIDLIATHEKYGQIPFTANPADCEEIGRQLYARALAGEFGEIAEYIPPVNEPAPTEEDQPASSGITAI